MLQVIEPEALGLMIAATAPAIGATVGGGAVVVAIVGGTVVDAAVVDVVLVEVVVVLVVVVVEVEEVLEVVSPGKVVGGVVVVVVEVEEVVSAPTIRVEMVAGVDPGATPQPNPVAPVMICIFPAVNVADPPAAAVGVAVIVARGGVNTEPATPTIPETAYPEDVPVAPAGFNATPRGTLRVSGGSANARGVTSTKTSKV